jgi:hypothetical protein
MLSGWHPAVLSEPKKLRSPRSRLFESLVTSLARRSRYGDEIERV